MRSRRRPDRTRAKKPPFFYTGRERYEAGLMPMAESLETSVLPGVKHDVDEQLIRCGTEGYLPSAFRKPLITLMLNHSQ